MLLETPNRTALDRSSQSLLQQYLQIRRVTETLCEPLSAEDCVVQSMPDASPAKWHLAHTSWFFETFVLTPLLPGCKAFNECFSFLFNSYYNAVGHRVARPKRGLLSRPSLEEVHAYRRHIDKHMTSLLERPEEMRHAQAVVTLGLNHEQQHQELILTDIKHLFGTNPVRPVYRKGTAAANNSGLIPLTWRRYHAGLRWIGHEGDGFAYDNESPRHREFVGEFHLGSRLVNNAEYLAFIEDGGYERPELWLSDGWNARGTHGWQSPLYWDKQGNTWQILTLAGQGPLVPTEPVCHVSYYEADAYARWARARLPTEAEWEVAAGDLPIVGNFLDSDRLHPTPPSSPAESQMFGDVWEWTSSPYTPYPGYRPAPGALGEYNGKFMCNQMVLRGGSCATPRSHMRATYRNFFPPEVRWQFSGIRLARDVIR